MMLAFSKPTAGDSEQRELFSSFRGAGYDGLQLKSGQYRRYLDDPRRFIDEWGAEPGAASMLIAGGRLNDAGIAELRRIFAFGEGVGSEAIVFCLGEPRDESRAGEAIRRYAARLSDLGGEARDHGLRLSLHNHFGQPVMRRDEIRGFFDAASDGAVGLTVDTAHLALSGVEEIADLLREFRGAIDNVHLKDLEGREFRVLGEGRLDFAPVFAALQEIEYDGWLCADEESGSDLAGGMAACRRFIVTGLDDGPILPRHKE